MTFACRLQFIRRLELPNDALIAQVNSPCGSVAGVNVQLSRDEMLLASQTTQSDGTCRFEGFPHGAGYSLTIDAASFPPGYAASTVTAGSVFFCDDTPVPFTLTCATAFSISGTVTSCHGAMGNVQVDLFDGNTLVATVAADTAGGYLFENIGAGDEYTLLVVTPLGYLAVEPVTFGLHANFVQDFFLPCLQAFEDRRSQGYWKHNVAMAVQGRTNGIQETAAELQGYADAIFHHFYENFTNSIDIEGVTFRWTNIDGVPMRVPLDLATMNATLNVKQVATIARARQQYLALLLNVAAMKLATWTEISDDQRTCSQAITYVAGLISDGVDSNDELAKTIADRINNGLKVGTGIIPDDTPNIPMGQRLLLPASRDCTRFSRTCSTPRRQSTSS